MMLAIGGVIGPGYFVGMGTGLSTAGPAGLLICFSIVGVLLWAVMQSLGELGAFIPMSGTCLLASKFPVLQPGLALYIADTRTT